MLASVERSGFDRIPDYLATFADLPLEVDRFLLTHAEAATSPLTKGATRDGVRLA